MSIDIVRAGAMGRAAAALSTAALAAVVALAAPLGAQTRFTWPDTAVDLAKYETIEECAAALLRVQGDDARRWSDAKRDTLPWRPAEAAAAPAPGIVGTARGCAARWDGATAPLADFPLLFPLLLAAGRDTDAAALAERRLATLRPAWNGTGGARTDSAQGRVESVRAAVVDTIARGYLAARPARLAAAESLVVTLRRSLARPYRVQPLVVMAGLYSTMFGFAEDLQDTARVRHYARQVLQLLDSAPASERAALEEQFQSAQRLAALEFGLAYQANGRQAAMDSLRKGSDVYLRYLLALWTQATDGATVPVDVVIGRQAPRLTGVVAGAAEGGGGPRPVPGRVNLVVIADDVCSDLTPHLIRDPRDCEELAAVLRRLARRHAGLEITLVDRTRGFVADLLTTDSTTEARERARALAAHRMPGVVVVGRTPFIHLPAPDDRRHDDEADANYRTYSFSTTLSMFYGTALLVDRDGTILRAENLTREREHDWSEMIGILLEHQAASR